MSPDLVVTLSSVEITVRRDTIVRETFSIEAHARTEVCALAAMARVLY